MTMQKCRLMVKKSGTAHYASMKLYTKEIIAFVNLAFQRDVTIQMSKLGLWSLQEYGFSESKLKKVLALLKDTGTIRIEDGHIVPQKLYDEEV